MISSYILELKKIYSVLIDFLEEDYISTNIIDVFNFLNENQIHEQSKYELKEMLVLLSKISKNHHRHSNFISKIQQIILLFLNGCRNLYNKMLNYFLTFRPLIFHKVIFLKYKTLYLHGRDTCKYFV